MIQVIHYNVDELTPLTDKVLRLYLAPTGGLTLHYLAGQYIELGISSQQYRAFSIANAPLGAKRLELHLRHQHNDPYTLQLLTDIREHRPLTLRGPLGRCIFQYREGKPIIFMAAGTGFAPIKAIIEDILATGIAIPLHLFWSANSANDLYLDDIPLSWEKHIPTFQYTPHLTGRHTNEWDIHNRITHIYPDLTQHQIYAAGPTGLILKTKSHFFAHGLPENQLFSDAVDLAR